MRISLIALFALAGCYSPAIPNGQQACSADHKCSDGYFCGADGHCYKNGTVAPSDFAVQRDMSALCTDDGCKAQGKQCDPDSHQCVDCLTDGNCPSGKL